MAGHPPGVAGRARVPVAVLGTGRMGRPVAARLAAAGHPLVVWNRTRSTAEDVAAALPGAEVVGTPAEAVRRARVVLTVLADDAAVTEVCSGPDGLVSGLRPGGGGRAPAPGVVVVDLSTVAPTTTASVREALSAAGAALVDAPVSGSVTAAAAGTLAVLAAGDADDVAAVQPVLEALGTVVRVGPSGAGTAMKLAVNTVLHELNQAVSEALVLAERAGIARTTAYDVLLRSAVAAPFLGYKQQAFLQPQDAPVAFRVSLAAKDLRLALALAGDLGAELPQARRALEVLEAAGAAGFAERDMSAVAEHLRALAPPSPPSPPSPPPAVPVQEPS